jgi:hypothetical protein
MSSGSRSPRVAHRSATNGDERGEKLVTVHTLPLSLRFAIRITSFYDLLD